MFWCGGQKANCFALVGLERAELCFGFPYAKTSELSQQVVMNVVNYKLDVESEVCKLKNGHPMTVFLIFSLTFFFIIQNIQAEITDSSVDSP